MTTHSYHPGEIDQGDPRYRDLAPDLAAALADREAQARAHRRAMHLALWPTALTAFSLGVLAGLAWSGA